MEENKKPVKRKGNNPKGGPQFELATEEGDNRKYLMVSMQLMNLPNIDLNNSQQVADRLNEYFKIHADADIKPTVAGMGLALNGLDRRRLWEIKTDSPSNSAIVNNLPRDSVDLIKKAYKLLENMMENYMLNGKINPVSGIFLAKNNFNYVDKVEHVVTPNTNPDADYDIEAIKNRRITSDS